MNEAIQAEAAKMQIVEFLGWLKELVQSGTDIAAKEVPETLGQLLAWKLCEHIFWIVLICSIGTGVLFLAKWFLKKYKENNYDSDMWGMGAILSYTFAPLVMIGVTAGNLYYLIMIIVAPRVYLLQYFTTLLKS